MINILKQSLQEVSRTIVDSNLYANRTKIVLLDFIGADQYYITEYGLIQNRKKVYPNRQGLVTKSYQPTAVLDRRYPYPWIQLDTTGGSVWFPVNQLLGWAFAMPDNFNKKYFICKHPGLAPQRYTEYTWSDKPSFEDTKSIYPSRYLSFMEQF